MQQASVDFGLPAVRESEYFFSVLVNKLSSERLSSVKTFFLLIPSWQAEFRLFSFNSK
jgi:hypothetical protein